MKNETSTSAVAPDYRPLTWKTKVLIPAAILLVAVAFFVVQRLTRPMAQRKAPPKQARQVHVQTVHRVDVRAVLDMIQGPVIPAQEVTLSPQVSGLVESLNPLLIPGQTVSQGQELLAIEARDYELILQERQSDVAKARLNLELEKGQQVIARQEYALLDEEVSEQDRALVLREPHLAETQAALEATQAAVQKAQLDVSRCHIVAPFNAVIRTKNVDVGMRVSPGSALVSLAGTDEYWVQASVPVGKLHWIQVPSEGNPQGSKVKIYDPAAWGPGIYREGRVIRLLSDIEPEGLMARLLISVEDPLALKPEHQGQPLMLLGALVDVEIQGKTLESVIPLARQWLRDGNHVWVVADDNTLKIQPVTTSFRGRESVCVVDGLTDGQQIVVTDIAAPVEGMPLRVSEGESSESQVSVSQGRAGE